MKQHINYTDDPADGYSQSWMNAPDQEKEVCSNCGELGIIERVKIDDVTFVYCNNCEHELKTLK